MSDTKALRVEALHLCVRPLWFDMGLLQHYCLASLVDESHVAGEVGTEGRSCNSRRCKLALVRFKASRYNLLHVTPRRAAIRPNLAGKVEKFKLQAMHGQASSTSV